VAEGEESDLGEGPVSQPPQSQQQSPPKTPKLFFSDSATDPVFHPATRHGKWIEPISPRRGLTGSGGLLTTTSTLSLPPSTASSGSEEPISPSVIRNEREREEVLERQMEEWENLAEEKLKKREEERKRMYEAHQRRTQRKQVRWDLPGEEVGEGLYDETAGMSVEEFLRALDLERYVEHFRTQEVDMELLRALSLNELMQSLGLPWGPAKKIVTKLHPSQDAMTFGRFHAPTPAAPPSPLFRNRSYHELRMPDRPAVNNAPRYNNNIGWLMGDEERRLNVPAADYHDPYAGSPRWLHFSYGET